MYSTYGAEEISAHYYMSRRIGPAPQGPEMIAPPSAELALMRTHPRTSLRSSDQFRSAIDDRYKALEDGTIEESYISFSDVTPDTFQSLNSRRHELGASKVRLTYFPDIETLIVKVPSLLHERAAAVFGHQIHRRLTTGMVHNREAVPVGSATYRGQRDSSKEADAAYQNQIVRPQDSQWPIFIIEAGMSESLDRLHSDVSWWIKHSDGKVRLVILVWVSPSTRVIKVETWVPARSPPSTGPCTRSRTAIPTLYARQLHNNDVEIDFLTTPPTYQGPNAIFLQFSDLIGRPPNPPGEHDVVLSRQDLLDFGEMIFNL